MKTFLSVFFVLFSFFSFSQDIPSIKVGKDKLGITSLDIKVDVVGNFAITTYDMLFFNPTNTILEGELAFPLGEGQRVSRLALEVNGKLREAVVVEKEQGRVAFEAVVRRGVDPVLLEKGTGNNYKARIYPIPANGYKRVVLAYEQELTLSEEAHYFQLPLEFKTNLDDFALEMNVFGQKLKPVVLKGSIENFQFKDIYNNFYAKIVKKNFTPKESLTIKIPQEYDMDKTMLFEDYFYSYNTLKSHKKLRKKAKKITLYWDVSLSMESRDLEKEIQFLDEYISYLSNVDIELVKFSNTVMSTEMFKIKNGDLVRLKEQLKNSIYDGGTSFSNLFKKKSSQEILLFSDGMKNLSDISVHSSSPIFVINSVLAANHSELNDISKSAKGEYINLKSASIEESLNKIKYQSFEFLGFESTNKELELYPIAPLTVSNDFSISAKGIKDHDSIILKFGYGNKVTLKKTIVCNSGINNALVRRIWSQKKLNGLQKESKLNKEAIVKHSLEYNLISNHTSLIVLETAWDYVKYKITPPDELLEEYNSILQRNKGKKVVSVLGEADEEIIGEESGISTFTGSGNISGVVTDANGTPLPGVNVMSIGTNMGTVTDFDGNYSIDAVEGSSLSFSYVGMISLETTIGVSSVINIRMEEDSSELDEVVVVGYGTSRKSSLTGSFSVVRSNELENFGGTYVADVLAGRIAGVHVSSNNGMPGTSPNVIIRGASTLSENNQPLYVVDGVPIQGSIDDFVTVNEIESINVIKDVAGATLYGSRASNGVIVITTKTNLNNNTSVRNRDSNRHDNSEPKNKKHRGLLKVKERLVKEVYIKELTKSKSLEEAYKMYLSQRLSYKESPTYFIDVFDYFKQWNNKDYAMRILSNVAELDFDNYEHLRVLAYKLEESNNYSLASFIYKKVLELRPEDSQSYRDLALAYKEIGLNEEALKLLSGITNGTIYKNKNRRVFEGVKNISANEISQLYQNHPELRAKEEDSVIKDVNTFDVRVVIDWNHNDTDIDLHVIDPRLEECFYSHSKTQIGGRLSKDMTQGFGPEEFTLINAEKGAYFIKVNYYGDRYQKINTPTFMKVTMFKNYGRPDEIKEVKVIRLLKRKEKTIVAKLDII